MTHNAVQECEQDVQPSDGAPALVFGACAEDIEPSFVFTSTAEDPFSQDWMLILRSIAHQMDS
eukprot:1095459-Rhodomonas_salina.1